MQAFGTPYSPLQPGGYRHRIATDHLKYRMSYIPKINLKMEFAFLLNALIAYGLSYIKPQYLQQLLFKRARPDHQNLKKIARTIALRSLLFGTTYALITLFFPLPTTPLKLGFSFIANLIGFIWVFYPIAPDKR